MDPIKEQELLASLADAYNQMYMAEADADNGVSGDEAMKRHGIKPHEGPMKVQKLKPRGPRKGEGFGIGARKRQGVSPPREDNPQQFGQKPNG